jgi:cytochrome c553
MKQAWRRLLMLLAVGMAPAVQAQAGAPKQIEVCASCHGVREMGSQDAGYPAIAGLPAAYIRAQLKAFRHGARDNVMMAAVASGVDEAQRRVLARYLAALPVAVTAHTGKVAPLNPIGAALAVRGAAGIPACASCHGTAGLGSGSFTRLAGQPADYLASQLRHWAADQRPAGNPPVMPAIAKRLSRAQIKAVSAYYAALPAGPTH